MGFYSFFRRFFPFKNKNGEKNTVRTKKSGSSSSKSPSFRVPEVLIYGTLGSDVGSLGSGHVSEHSSIETDRDDDSQIYCTYDINVTMEPVDTFIPLPPSPHPSSKPFFSSTVDPSVTSNASTQRIDNLFRPDPKSDPQSVTLIQERKHRLDGGPGKSTLLSVHFCWDPRKNGIGSFSHVLTPTATKTEMGSYIQLLVTFIPPIMR